VSVVLFDGFELLDVFGPVELFGMVPGKVDVEFVGPQAGAVASGQGAQAIATSGYAAAAPADIVLVPGGRGTRAPLGALLAAVPLGPCAHSHYSSAPASVRHLGRRDRCGRTEAQKSRKQSGQCVARITVRPTRDLG